MQRDRASLPEGFGFKACRFGGGGGGLGWGFFPTMVGFGVQGLGFIGRSTMHRKEASLSPKPSLMKPASFGAVAF